MYPISINLFIALLVLFTETPVSLAKPLTVVLCPSVFAYWNNFINIAKASAPILGISFITGLGTTVNPCARLLANLNSVLLLFLNSLILKSSYDYRKKDQPQNFLEFCRKKHLILLNSLCKMST